MNNIKDVKIKQSNNKAPVTSFVCAFLSKKKILMEGNFTNEDMASLLAKIDALGKVNQIIANEILTKKSFSVVKYSAIVVDWKIGLKEEKFVSDSTFFV
jgi:hypothetical protein